MPKQPSLTRELLADNVAEAIVRALASEGVHKGDPLPPVTKLSEQFSVSRAVVREALEKLAKKGAISREQSRRWVMSSTTRRSKAGGPEVTSQGNGRPAIPHRSLADQAAAAVLDLIQTKGLKEGGTLPPSGELSKRFGVSVIVMREALASLAARGVLYRRQGRESVVALPSHELISSIMQFRAYLEDIDIEDFQAARTSLEMRAARLAAERGDGIERKEVLEGCLKGMRSAGNEEDFNESDLAFHLGIAHLSDNRAVELLLASLNHIVRRSLDVTYRRIHSRAGVKGIEIALHNHERIAKAIIKGDGEAASRAMAEHFAYVVSNDRKR